MRIIAVKFDCNFQFVCVLDFPGHITVIVSESVDGLQYTLDKGSVGN